MSLCTSPITRYCMCLCVCVCVFLIVWDLETSRPELGCCAKQLKKKIGDNINFTFNRCRYFKFTQDLLTDSDETTEKVSVLLYLHTKLQAWGFRSFGLPGGVLFIPDVSKERIVLVFI